MSRPGPREGCGGDAIGGGHVVVDHARSITSLVLHGEIDASLEVQLAAWRDEAVAAGYAITVNAQHVSFMDSRAVAFLVRLYQGVRPERVTVVQPASGVLYLLKLTQLTDLLDVVLD